MGSVTVIVGGQYGSEGKGNLVATQFSQCDIHVRVGSPNAGHTIFDPISQTTHKMQSLPCGWINRKAMLVIGAGAIIDPHQLEKELNEIELLDPSIRSRVMVDRHAWCISPADRELESMVGMNASIGSTQEGVGVARIRRIEREMSSVVRQAQHQLKHLGIGFADTVHFLHNQKRSSLHSDILVEGTQGSALSLYHGSWPFTTSVDTNAAGIMSEVGLPIDDSTRIVLVFRTFPIRVAGNSGPMRGELSWQELSEEVGRPLKERTTVTKKIRRVARWDEELAMRSININNPSTIAIMFADYVDSTMYDKTEVTEKFFKWCVDAFPRRRDWHKIGFVGTSEKTVFPIFEGL